MTIESLDAIYAIAITDHAIKHLAATMGAGDIRVSNEEYRDRQESIAFLVNHKYKTLDLGHENFNLTLRLWDLLNLTNAI